MCLFALSFELEILRFWATLTFGIWGFDIHRPQRRRCVRRHAVSQKVMRSADFHMSFVDFLKKSFDFLSESTVFIKNLFDFLKKPVNCLKKSLDFVRKSNVSVKKSCDVLKHSSGFLKKSLDLLGTSIVCS